MVVKTSEKLYLALSRQVGPWGPQTKETTISYLNEILKFGLFMSPWFRLLNIFGENEYFVTIKQTEAFPTPMKDGRT